MLCRGVEEPAWDVFGWHLVPGSLPITGIAVDAYWSALDRLSIPFDEAGLADLLDFLLRCRTKSGGFAHNELSDEHSKDVQNATASALNLLTRVASREGGEGHPVWTGLDATRSRLQRGQDIAGFWPYVYPGSRVRKAIDGPLRAVFKPRKFFFYRGSGDTMHHLMTFYFAARHAASSSAGAKLSVLESAWRWTRERLIKGADGSISIDWSADPVLHAPQGSNARDTNAYFLILGTLPLLSALGLISVDESTAFQSGLSAHVEAKLMSRNGRAPCVTPAEGPPDIVRNILPMVEQSAAWKGRLLADVIPVDMPPA